MATMVSRPSKARIDDCYFTGMSVVILGIVLLGFARTYYLAGALHAPLPSVIIHIHAVVFSSWIVLLLAQTSLVTVGRADWHKKVGILGAILAVLMVVLGLAAAIDTQTRHTTIPGIDPPGILAIQFAELAVFAFLVTKGIGARREGPAHKRLMLLATITLMGPAINRWPFAFLLRFPPATGLIIDVLLLGLIAFDYLTRRKIHRVTIWGSLLIFIAVPCALSLSHLPFWLHFTGWLRQ
jgi:hypothetical protein